METIQHKRPRSDVNPSRKERWYSNYSQIREFYNEHGHLSLKCDRLSQWLTYQRLHAKSLDDDQLSKLDEIHYKDATVFRECDDKAWKEKIEEIRRSSGKFSKSLSAWLTRQRQALAAGGLERERKEELEELGINLTLHIKKRNTTIISQSKQAQWMKQFETLVKYVEKNGHCNVPKRYRPHGLGEWVHRQKKNFRSMKESDDPFLQERVDKLCSLGFLS